MATYDADKYSGYVEEDVLFFASTLDGNQLPKDTVLLQITALTQIYQYSRARRLGPP